MTELDTAYIYVLIRFLGPKTSFDTDFDTTVDANLLQVLFLYFSTIVPGFQTGLIQI